MSTPDTLRAALAWYAEQARLCRLIHSEGDTGRQALAGDGGERARAALAQPQQAAPGFDADGFRAFVLRELPDDTVIGRGAWWADHLTKWAQKFAATAAPAGQAAAPDYSEDLTRAKRLLVKLWDKFPDARSMIEGHTGTWFAWGIDRNSQQAPAAEAVQPPAQAVRLTDEQIAEMCGEANRGFCIEIEDYRKAVRDAERAVWAANGLRGE